MLKSVSHYLQRSWELGPWGALRRVWVRTTNGLVLWGQSLWWGWWARREMSDAALLARTTGNWRSVDAVLKHLASRPASSFVLPHDSPSETAAILNRHFPGYLSAVLAAADASCRNELSLLGGKFRFAEGIDWQKDPVTGWRWPSVHRSRVGQYLGSDRAVDLQVFWKLNRHQHFITLGIAFWLTGDQRYVDTFSVQIQSWIETNPLQHGVNWHNGIDVSIRIIAWTVAFQFFRSSPTFREKTGKAFLRSLWQQADFLSSHLQTAETPGVVPNNHMMAELTGLALVGAAFPEFRNAAAWRETGLRLLEQQATAQTHPDGVNKEQATGYHRFVAELLLLIVAGSRQGALPHELILENTLEHMLDYVLFTLSPAGTAPMWGDSDYGCALGLGYDKDFWDFRPILAAGAALFGRPDWKFVAGHFDEEAFWLLGVEGLNRWEELDAHPPKQTSRGFPDAGLYVIRDAWAADTDVALIRCGPFGLGSEGHCAHAHCDLLSFVLWVNGQPLLVDSGTYMYHGPWRDHFRLTAAHNTVMIDGREQAMPMPHFNWKAIPEAKCIVWTGERVTGALTSSDGVVFTRELTHPRPGVWELVDRFTGRDEHTMEWSFHLAPGLDVELCEERHTLTVLKDGQSFLVVHIPDGGVRPQLRDSWYSHQYGVKQWNRELYARWQGELDGNGVSFHWRFQVVNESPLPAGG
jgi:hypothetical protein